jgi:predicted ATPase
MKYLLKFKLKKKLYTIKPFTIEFKDGLNLIVGDNGSGKSTLIALLTKSDYEQDIKELTLTDDCKINGTEFKFFDTEKQNPRLKHEIEHMYDVASHFMSHGEAIFPMVSAVETMKDIVVFVDEPEAAVSLKNQKIIYDSFIEAEKNNCQLIICTHSYVLIKNCDEVFDMGSRKWVKSNEYLKQFDDALG